jgi:hypothetical protein
LQNCNKTSNKIHCSPILDHFAVKFLIAVATAAAVVVVVAQFIEAFRNAI